MSVLESPALAGLRVNNGLTLIQLNSSLAIARNSGPSSLFFGRSLKKQSSKINNPKVLFKRLKAVVEYNEEKQTSQDRWRGLVTDNQQDITRGKGMVDALFQAPMGTGTHYAVMSSYDYISAGLQQFAFDDAMDGFYFAPAIMDKVVVQIVTK